MSESANQTRQPRPRRGKPRLRRLRRRRASAVTVVAVLGIPALAFAAWSGFGQTATAGTRSAASATSASASGAPATGAPASSAPATAVSPLAVGPVALKPASPSQVAAWKAGPGGATLAAVTAQVGTVLMTHDGRQFVQMKRECISLAADVTAAGAQPAIPDPAMQNLYSKALASLAAGAANCQAAVSSHQEGDEDLVTKTNSSLLATAMSQLTVGTRDLYVATYSIKGLKRG